MSWKRTGQGNEILEGNDFHISYNALPGYGIPSWGSDTGGSETALVKKDPQRFYILNGDFRKKYEEIIHLGFEACLMFFKENEEYQTSWSSKETHKEERKKIK